MRGHDTWTWLGKEHTSDRVRRWPCPEAWKLRRPPGHVSSEKEAERRGTSCTEEITRTSCPGGGSQPGVMSDETCMARMLRGRKSGEATTCPPKVLLPFSFLPREPKAGLQERREWRPFAGPTGSVDVAIQGLRWMSCFVKMTVPLTP